MTDGKTHTEAALNDLADMTASASQFNEVLHGWDGCVCRLWSYGMSHSTFSFYLHRQGFPTLLKVYCISPHHYCGPLSWGKSRLRATVEEADPLNLIVLRDDGPGFTIRCRYVQWEEGPPPPWVYVPSDDPPPAG